MDNETTNPALPPWVQTVVIGRHPKWTLIRIAVLVIVCFVVSQFVLRPVRIYGPSMEPTYHDHSINFVNRLAYLRHAPRRGDVVAIRFSGESVMYLKRVVGLPGETVAFIRGKLFVNGEPQDEPYVKTPCRWNRPPEKLGPDEYFVVGDNREMRLSEHDHGKAARERIIGKAFL